MDLLTRLRDLAAKLPPSHLINEAEAARVVSALIGYSQHGDELLHAAENGVEHVSAFLSDVAANEVPEEGRTDAATGRLIPGSRPDQQAGPEPVSVSADDHAALVAELQQTQADLADARRATVTSEPPPDPAAAPVDPAAEPADPAGPVATDPEPVQ